VIANFTSNWRASKAWITKSGFVSEKGDIRIALRQQVVQSNIDVGEHFVTIQEYLKDTKHQGLIAFTFDDLNIYRALGPDYTPLPEPLRRIHGVPTFTLGRNGSGSGAHFHEEAWVAQLAGRKAWLVAPQSEDDHPSNSVEPCTLFANGGERFWPPGARRCTVEAGEVMYVPGGWYHATCNLDDFTLGVGGKGSSRAWPEYMHHIQAGNEDALRSMVMNDPSVDLASAQDPPAFHLAAAKGPTSVLGFLLEQRVDPQSRDDRGRSAVHWAAEHGSVETLQFLAARGLAKLSDRAGGLEPLHVAVQQGHLPVTSWMLEKRADVNRPDGDGDQPIHFAVGTGRLPLIERLLAHRANPSARGANGISVVCWAAGHNHTTVLQLLASSRARLDSASGKEKSTPLHWAASKGYAHVAEYLLSARVQADRAGHGLLVELLLRHGANVGAVSAGGALPAEMARDRGHRSLAQHLQSLRAKQGHYARKRSSDL